MQRLFESVLLLLATAMDNQLARQLQYLKVENAILLGKLPRRITVTARERSRLIKYGKLLGSAIKDLISIVSARTFARWLRGASTATKRGQPAARPGRPSTPDEIRDLILLLARENPWGYTRILGELKKLGIPVSRSTVVNILRAAGIDTGPKRGEGTWADFIRRQAATMWACDFLGVKAWTSKGLVTIYVLFFIHIGSRRVRIAGMTTNPDRAWVTEKARETAAVFATQPDKPTHLIRDLDSKFGPEFDAAFQALGMEIVPVGPRAPNLNSFAERWVGSVRRECLDRFIFFGEKHLQHVINSYVEHYTLERPHQGLDNRPLAEAESAPPVLPFVADQLVCQERLGGLLKHYQRRQAA